MRSFHLLATLMMFALSNPLLGLCEAWSKPEKIGALDTEMVDEASGLAISQVHSNRLYHINDSGDGPFFYQSDRKEIGRAHV